MKRKRTNIYESAFKKDMITDGIRSNLVDNYDRKVMFFKIYLTSTPNYSSSPIIFFGLYYGVLLMFSNDKYT